MIDSRMIRRMALAFLGVLLVAIVVAALWTGWYVYRFLQIDRCLDSGGSWDYERCECVH